MTPAIRVRAPLRTPAAVPPIVHAALRAPGQPLDPAVRAELEPRFRHSFADVRVHTDGQAARSARAVGAHAYTVGRDVVFAAGRYAPGTEDGQRLIAHELAHVAQQRGASRSIQPRLEIGAADDPAEREAEAAASAVAEGAAISVPAGSGAVLRRQTPPDGGMDGVDAGPRHDAGTVPDAGAPPDAAQTPAPAQAADAGTPPPPPSPPPPCTPTALTRAAYLAAPGTSTGDFGLTVLSGQVTIPVVRTTRVRGGVRVEPTSAALPPITSVFTGPGVFNEDTLTWTQQEPGVGCRTARYPIRWTITGPGAARIMAGEMEHCADFQQAFAISLRRYADAVNALAASRRVFGSARAAEAAVTRTVGVPPARWMEVFECLAARTTLRDGRQGRRGWHTPQVRRVAPRQNNGCAFAEMILEGNALPEVGQHPAATLIQGCGEAGPARP